MAKKKTQREPSDNVHDTYRRRNAGVVDVAMNDKRSTSDYYVDRAELGTHPVGEYIEGKGFKVTEVQNHIKQNARLRMGDLKFESSNKASEKVTRGFSNLAIRHPR